MTNEKCEKCNGDELYADPETLVIHQCDLCVKPKDMVFKDINHLKETQLDDLEMTNFVDDDLAVSIIKTRVKNGYLKFSYDPFNSYIYLNVENRENLFKRIIFCLKYLFNIEKGLYYKIEKRNLETLYNLVRERMVNYLDNR